MRRLLPIAWIIVGIVSLAIALLAMAPIYNTAFQPVFLAKLPSLVLSSMFVVTLAAIYALLNRVCSRTLVVGLGWTHLASYFFSKLGEANFDYLRHRTIVAGDRFETDGLLLATGVSALANLVSAIAFLAVILVAFSDVKTRIRPETFD